MDHEPHPATNPPDIPSGGTQLHSLLKALRESEGRFRAIFEGAGMGISVVDRDARIVVANPAIQVMLGYTLDELRGKSFYDITHPDDRPMNAVVFAELLAGDIDGYQFEKRYVRKDGESVWVRLWVSLFPGPASATEFVISLVEDITAQKRTETAEQEQRRLAEALRDTAAFITSTLDLDEVLDRILVNVERVVPHDTGNIMLLTPDGREAYVAHWRGHEARGLSSDFVRRFRVRTDELVNMRQMFTTRQPVLVADTYTFEGWLHFPETRWIRSHVGAPIICQDEVLGFVQLDSSEPGHFKPSDAQLLKAFADQTAVAVRNARLYRQLEQHNDQLEQAVRERTAELVATNDQLRRVSRVKDEFVSNVSHELRTPVASLKLFHDLLVLNPQRFGAYMEHVRRETRRLERLIEDLLHLSRLDQERVELKLESINLNALVESYIADRRLLAEQKALTLTFTPHTPLPDMRGDAALIGQVISVLLTNAINYTPAAGSIRVETHARLSNGHSSVGFSISDTGPGIHPEDHPRLFERFFRGQAAVTSGTPGTGLGLAIAREIVDRHHGQIMVSSAGGQGTTFHVCFPLDPASAGQDPATLN